MKEMKRFLSLLLAVVMIVGMMPANVFAEETSAEMLTAAIFFSDVHEESTGTSGSGTSAMKSVLSTIGKNGVSYETIGLVGDTYTDKAGTMTNMTAAAQGALGQNIPCYYAYGDHDEESDISPDSGLMYTGDHYYIYHISDANMRSKVASQSEIDYGTAITNFKNDVAAMDKSKILFIMSHAPLHDRRDDNTYANDWYTAITEVAKTMDVVVFWAHNHTNEDNVDRAAYYVAKNGDETMTIYGGSTVTPNFTYMNAGYIYAAGQNPSRKGVATTVEIYADKMVFQDYNSSGEYTDSSYSHNVTVTREHAASTPTLESIAISGANTYTVGDELDLKVTATYSDSTTADVTEKVTFSGYNMSVAGAQTVTATYEGKTATYAIAVVNAPKTLAVTAETAYTVGDALKDPSEIVVTFSDGSTKKLSDATASLDNLSVECTGLTDGVFAAAGTYDVVYTYTEGGYTATATLAVTVSEPVTLSSIAISGTNSYTVGDELALTVTATYSDGSTKDVTADATLSGYDMDSVGVQTVTATYEGLTATYTISVAEPYLVSVALTSAPTKLTYVTGETLDTTGMVVTATYSDGSTVDVTDKATLSGYDMTTVGEQTVKVSYTLNSTTYNNMSFTITVEEDVSNLILEKIEITTPPTKTEYLLSEELSLDGMVVVATFSDGSTKEIAYKPFSTSTVYGGYELYNFSMYVKKAHELTVVYTFGEVTCYDTTTINVWAEDFEDETTHVIVHVTGDYGVTDVTVSEKAHEDVASAISSVISGESYVAYDIELAFDEGYSEVDATKTVTLPIPDGVTNPVVYYVSEDGEIVKMDATNNGDGTVTFTTTHFSTYVVGEDGTVSELESGNATVEGGEDQTVTTKTAEEVTVYKLVSTPTSGKTYLIVNSNTGTGYGLDGDTTGYATTVFTGGSDYYSSWDDSTKTGTAFAAGSDVYLTTDGAYLWTAGSNSFSIGYDDSQGVGDWATTHSYELNPANGTMGTWSLSNGILSVSLVTNDSWFGSDTYTTYYLSGGQTWSMSTTSANVYFYEPVTVYKVTETTTTIPGDVGHTYSVEGTDITDAVAISGQTVNLSSVLYDTPDGGTATDITASSGLTPTYEVVTTKGNPAVISSISGSTATLSGVVGTAVVKVTYTSGDLVAWDEFVVTTTAPTYGLNITDPESSQIKIGAALDLDATATLNSAATTLGSAITWTSSNTAIATVDASTGAVTGVAVGSVTITATWTDPNGKVHTDTQGIEVVDAVYALDLCEPVWTEVSITEFDDGTTYYTKNADGTYAVATEYVSGTTYYTLSTKSIESTIVLKSVTNEQQYANVWAVITADGVDLGKLNEEQLKNLTFISSNTNIATVDSTTGVVTFKGTTGTVSITAMYEYAEGKYVTDTVIFSLSNDADYRPDDGTDDFPKYPAEGSVRFDKTATAVGNFSKTGITKVELSMTGVPYAEGHEMDVVLMLDTTGSMSDDALVAMLTAAGAFVDKIAINEDGTYNGNHIAVYFFNSSGITTVHDLGSFIDENGKLIDSDTSDDYASDYALVKHTLNPTTYASGSSYDFSSIQSSGGTPFDEAAAKCQTVLADHDEGGDNYCGNSQYCVFMSDGGPTTYKGSDGYTYYGGNASGNRKITSYIGDYTSSTSSSWTYNLPTEYYTDAMKATDVTVYTVGMLMQNVPENPSPYSSMTESTYDADTDTLTTVGSHYYFTSTILKNMASDESKYYDIFSVANVDKAVAAFETIAQSILEAAKDVKVTDKIADDFTMVFEAPNTTVGSALPSGQEFYIEVLDYALTAVDSDNDGVVDDYVRGTATSKMKVYLGTATDTEGNYYYYAASDANGTPHATPVFNTTALGTKYYWTTTADDGDSGVSVVDADGTTYYFISTGNGTHNMASGAFASGNKTTVNIVDSDTGEVTGTSTTSTDLIIATPYFVYNASTRMLIWTAEKLSSSELALSYFLYLDESGGWSGAKDEAEAKTYETNDYAYLNYTNFQNNPCEQVFPVPQITWNGAQVSYVFYLVNEDGKPVNRAGRVVPFSEAVYVTDVYTHSIIWNDLEQMASLEADYLAKDLVPEVYALYDQNATYNIHVFEDEAAQNLNNHFVIGGNTKTTHVFNTKHDETKYTIPATYAATSNYLCKDYDVTVNEDGSVTYNGTKEQYTENGVAVVGTDDKGAYAIVKNTGATVVETGFDFSNTTVAFAVTWKPELVEDTVVVDFGLDVVIDVTTNDALASGVVGVRTEAPSGVEMNKGSYTASKATRQELKLNGVTVGTATVENLTSVRFSLDKTNGMQFNAPITFYYESDVNYYEGTTLNSTSMYSSVTVIPATTVYYEDSFVSFESYTDIDDKKIWDSTSGYVDGINSGTTWTTEGTTVSDNQDTDRPGADKVGTINGVDYDADNVYGYDSAYTSMSTWSMGSAAKMMVDATYFGKAKFSFYGTGFDVISLTSNQTGTIVGKVTDSTGAVVRNKVVDTYYGYTQNADGEWVTSTNDPNALYQVPVIKVEGLDYAKYDVVITVAYNSFFAHNGATSYDFYLDAIRIYDPTGVVSGTVTDETVSNAYIADGEGWPVYRELRNNIISGTHYTVTENEDGTVSVTVAEGDDNIGGAIFIDCNDATTSIADYISYGPNNELYLAPGQAIAFNVDTYHKVSIEKFEDGVTYYTKNTDGTYVKADSEYSESTNYYLPVADIQLGIKVGNGNSVTYEINGESYTTNSATDLYYSILKYAKAGTVTIKNVSGGILSLTNIKVTHTSAPATESGISLLSMDAESAGFALMSLRAAPVVEEPEVEETVPETTEPEVEETVPEATEPEAEETEPETTEPEVEETEPETTEPEAEETVPETTEPEVEETVPETTEPEQEETSSVVDTVVNFVKNLANQFKNWFGKWFN